MTLATFQGSAEALREWDKLMSNRAEGLSLQTLTFPTIIRNARSKPQDMPRVSPLWSPVPVLAG